MQQVDAQRGQSTVSVFRCCLLQPLSPQGFCSMTDVPFHSSFASRAEGSSAAPADSAAPAASRVSVPVLSSLAACAAFYWECLATPQRCALRRGLRGRSWRLGTACSGSDSVVRVLEHIGRSCGWEFTHVFSCECDPEKQAWVREHWPCLPLLFQTSASCTRVVASMS